MVQVVSAGYTSTCAIASYRLWCWGTNDVGQLGNKSKVAVPNAALAVNVLQSDGTQLPGQIKQISTGVEGSEGPHSCAIDSLNQLWCWGKNDFGQLGIGTTVDSNYAQQVKINSTTNITNVTDISVGLQHTCAIASGTVYCWGSSWFGETGQSPTTPISGLNYATIVKDSLGASLTGATKIAVGQRTSCAIKASTVLCWGINREGELGNGLGGDSTVPVLVKKNALDNLTGVTNLSVGQFHICATTTDKTMWCWGENAKGQLGVGVINLTGGLRYASLVLKSVGNSLTGVLDISLGENHTCARLSTGMWCWGSNTYGQLGDGSKTQRSYPVQVALLSGGLLSNVISISAGRQYTCAVANSKALCWGSNSFGTLGDNTTVDKSKAIINGL